MPTFPSPDHVAQAEDAVAKGRRTVERQAALVADLERHGHDASQARGLLVIFQQVQLEHEAHRDRLKAELAEGGQR